MHIKLPVALTGTNAKVSSVKIVEMPLQTKADGRLEALLRPQPYNGKVTLHVGSRSIGLSVDRRGNIRNGKTLVGKLRFPDGHTTLDANALGLANHAERDDSQLTYDAVVERLRQKLAPSPTPKAELFLPGQDTPVGSIDYAQCVVDVADEPLKTAGIVALRVACERSYNLDSRIEMANPRILNLVPRINEDGEEEFLDLPDERDANVPKNPDKDQIDLRERRRLAARVNPPPAVRPAQYIQQAFASCATELATEPGDPNRQCGYPISIPSWKELHGIALAPCPACDPLMTREALGKWHRTQKRRPGESDEERCRLALARTLERLAGARRCPACRERSFFCSACRRQGRVHWFTDPDYPGHHLSARLSWYHVRQNEELDDLLACD